MTGTKRRANKQLAKAQTSTKKLTRSQQMAVIEELPSNEEEVEIQEFSPVVQELEVDREFLATHDLSEIVEALDAQGWDHLFEGEFNVDEALMREFYETLDVKDLPGLLMATFNIKGKAQVLAHEYLGVILGVPAEGYSDYVKGTWPPNIAKREIILRIGEDETNSTSPGISSKLGIRNRTLHKIVCMNITPRK